jgi:hypothetical protein
VSVFIGFFVVLCMGLCMGQWFFPLTKGLCVLSDRDLLISDGDEMDLDDEAVGGEDDGGEGE